MDKRIPLFWNATQQKVEALDVSGRDEWPDVNIAEAGSFNQASVTGNIIFVNIGDGVVLRSPNGNTHLVTVNNDGSLLTTVL